MSKFGISQPVLRIEDERLLKGQGCFLDDVPLEAPLHAVMVRSIHAHADLLAIDTAPAMALPGVVAVLTARDVVEAGIGDQPCLIPLDNRDGTPRADPGHPVLAADRVRHVGDNIAMVVADTLAAAHEGAAAVLVDYAPCQAMSNLATATHAGAPDIWPEARGNIAFDWFAGDQEATDKAFGTADHVVRLTLTNNRIAISSMEPRGAIGQWNPDSGRYTFWCSSQGVHLPQKVLCDMLGIEPSQLRVITPDVGGGFGMKIFMYSEYPLVLLAARKFGRPVKWAGERTDAFLSDTQGRDTETDAELALDTEGHFLGLRMSTKANMGAYLSTFAPMIPTGAGTRPLPSVYRIATAAIEVKGVFTNSTPVDAYRGAGRPETIYVLERLVDKAACLLGLTQDEIRRRNFVSPTEMPWKLALGQTIDSGKFEQTMELAMGLAGWESFSNRREVATGRNQLTGIGMAYYMEVCGGGEDETAAIQFQEDGTIDLIVGTQSNGQGHATAYSQIIADRLGLPLTAVRFVEGDTDLVASGRGTGGSRSLPVCGSAVLRSAEGVIEKASPLAAHALEASVDDLAYEPATASFRIVGTDRRIELTQLAALARNQDATPDGFGAPGLDVSVTHLPDGQTVPNGCHICEVEISKETGAISITRFTVVDDFGVILNPMMAAGQVHGGVAQGIGQALLENSLYDPESGQLLSGSFMDYALPRADHFPDIEVTFNKVPCLNNPLGMKGAGEAGAVGAPAALVNAVRDALGTSAGDDLQMPLTSEQIWSHLRRPDAPA